ncbi:MAG: hypothetical protein LBU68_02225 [Rickettsiales bacterium]|jgi:F0F1-type ATP synthase membrane subunit b/b'|nr:hypothetical protein [Rickettsiales bacterium]
MKKSEKFFSSISKVLIFAMMLSIVENGIVWGQLVNETTGGENFSDLDYAVTDGGVNKMSGSKADAVLEKRLLDANNKKKMQNTVGWIGLGTAAVGLGMIVGGAIGKAPDAAMGALAGVGTGLIVAGGATAIMANNESQLTARRIRTLERSQQDLMDQMVDTSFVEDRFEKEIYSERNDVTGERSVQGATGLWVKGPSGEFINNRNTQLAADRVSAERQQQIIASGQIDVATQNRIRAEAEAKGLVEVAALNLEGIERQAQLEIDKEKARLEAEMAQQQFLSEVDLRKRAEEFCQTQKIMTKNEAKNIDLHAGCMEQYIATYNSERNAISNSYSETVSETNNTNSSVNYNATEYYCYIKPDKTAFAVHNSDTMYLWGAWYNGAKMTVSTSDEAETECARPMVARGGASSPSTGSVCCEKTVTMKLGTRPPVVTRNFINSSACRVGTSSYPNRDEVININPALTTPTACR